MLWEAVFLNPIAGGAPHSAELVQDLPAEARNLDTLMDSDAFAAFYQRSARPLWAYLARVSADPALADDLMQESFVRFLCAARPELSLAEGEVAARRYLFRIATNLLRDHWRRPVSASIEELPEEFFAAADRSGQADSQAVLGPALAEMRPRERQLLWLAHAEGYSHHEIAQITGLASASIRLLLFRARRKIARILKTQGTPPAVENNVEKNALPQAPANYRSQP
ncbi:MAG TPA: sigma-70 family RNA polymerase sigma factor [Terracidiphilus sp.]|jgi:RNA polymerase sigma-70 factor (ECF subfamily)